MPKLSDKLRKIVDRDADSFAEGKDNEPVSADIMDDEPIEEQKAAPLGSSRRNNANNVQLVGPELAAHHEDIARRRDAQQNEVAIFAAYKTALTRRRLINVEIASVEEDNECAYWIAYDGPVTVRIPFAESLSDLPAELYEKGNPGIIRRQVQMLSKCLSITVPVRVLSVEEDPEYPGTYIATGSRIKALAAIRARYFGPKAPRPVKVGDNVDAKVVAVGYHAAYLEVCGMDIRIDAARLTHRYTRNMKNAIQPGDTIKVRVLEMGTIGNSKTQYITQISARPCEMEQFKHNLRRIKPYARYRAQVVNHKVISTPDGPRVRVNLFLEGVNVPGFASSWIVDIRNRLLPGNMVTVEAFGVTEAGYVHCDIVEIR